MSLAPVRGTFVAANKLTAVFQSSPDVSPSTYDLFTASPDAVGVPRFTILLLLASKFAPNVVESPSVLFVSVCEPEFVVTVESMLRVNVPAPSL